MPLSDILLLISLSLLAIDFGRRILKYAQTRDPGYKHRHLYFGKTYHGKH